MAIYRMATDKEGLEPVEEKSLSELGIRERSHLQRMLRDRPEILEDGLLIIDEEFGNFQDSNRRIDLLALDATGRLVVIELKRGETGEHMDLQAIRYAAMVANMTYQQAVDTCQSYLERRAADEGKTVKEDEAESLIREHLVSAEEETQTIHTEIPRIILASENFSKELTTCVMWLNDSWLSSEKLDIKCVRLKPHINGNETLLETSVVIPLPEASDYRVQLGKREQEKKVINTGRSQHMPDGRVFLESINSAPEQFRPHLKRLYDWAAKLEKENLAKLSTSPGSITTLPVTVPGESALVSFRIQPNVAQITFQANKFRVLAPKSMPLVSKISGINLADIKTATRKNLSNVTEVLDDLLAALTNAYREANGLPVGDEAPDG